jgi:hypothetical protein
MVKEEEITIKADYRFWLIFALLAMICMITFAQLKEMQRFHDASWSNRQRLGLGRSLMLDSYRRNDITPDDVMRLHMQHYQGINSQPVTGQEQNQRAQ